MLQTFVAFSEYMNFNFIFISRQYWTKLSIVEPCRPSSLMRRQIQDFSSQWSVFLFSNTYYYLFTGIYRIFYSNFYTFQKVIMEQAIFSFFKSIKHKIYWKHIHYTVYARNMQKSLKKKSPYKLRTEYSCLSCAVNVIANLNCQRLTFCSYG